jgi:hypothetical protein
MTARLTNAQQGRQQVRKNGKYANFAPCYGECGGRVNPENYFSHAMTDCVDSEGQGFDDLLLMICEKCLVATAHITTLREGREYIARNVARRATPTPSDD